MRHARVDWRHARAMGRPRGTWSCRIVAWPCVVTAFQQQKGRNSLLLSHGRVVTLIPAHDRVV